MNHRARRYRAHQETAKKSARRSFFGRDPVDPGSPRSSLGRGTAPRGRRHALTALGSSRLRPERRPERARYYQLAIYAVSTLDETVVPLFFHTVVYPPERRKQEIVDQKTPIWATAAAFLTRELGEGPYFLGKSFSAADVIVGYDLALAAKAGLLKGHPTLQAYTERVTSREAFKKA